MFARITLAGLATGLLLTGIGCGRHKKFCRDDCPPRATPSPGGPGLFLDDPVPSPRSGGGIPPPNVPTTPGGGSVDPLPPPVLPDSRGSFRIDPTTPPGPWEPAPSRSAFRPDPPPRSPAAPPRSRTGAELLLPESPSGGSAPPPTIDLPSGRKPGVAAFLDEPVRPFGGSDLPPRAETERSTPSPSPTADRPAPPPASSQRSGLLNDPATRGPVGLPGFQVVKDRNRDGVAAGGKPTLDGFDWLKASGYRTVVYVHDPSENPSAARDLAEQRGLRFVPIEVTPASLRSAYSDFARTVEDRSARPVYVADADGRRAGVLWYLLFRKADLLGEDAARVRAGSLGLTDTSAGESKQLWDAARGV